MPSSSSSETLPHNQDDVEKNAHCEAGTEKGPAGTVDSIIEVSLEKLEHPQSLSSLRKWVAVLVISSGSMCVTCASSMAGFTEQGIAAEFSISHTVSILSISLFVTGLGVGPLLVGPLSEMFGRNVVYRASYGFYFIFTFPVAFAPDAAVFLFFRFVTGFCGAAFLSVAGGSVSDMFSDTTVANPMAVYTISPFIGPVLGPLLGGFINQNLYWRWTYRIQLIWVFVELVALCTLVPETYVPVLTKWKAARLRKSSGNPAYLAPLDRGNKDILSAIIVSCYTPFQLMIFDRMALLLNIWTALILGILYLAFQAFPIIFGVGHGFNVQTTGLTFLGIGVGMFTAISTQPFWNRLFTREAAKHGGRAPPETRLIMGQVGGILVPLGLLWLAFTTYPSVPWPVPIVASIPFGSGIYFVFTSTFTYLVTAYRPIAASAMAANSAMRSAFAAGFPLFAGALYHRLGTVGATGLLAGLTALMAPLPFIFYRIGPSLRAKSRFTAV